MKTFTICAFSALFGAISNAAPLNKRDVVWVTEWDIDTVTVPVTKTVWVNAPDSTQEAVIEHEHSHSAWTSPAASTTTESSSSSAVYVAPTVSSTTSVYVAPTTSSSSVYVAPTTTSTSAYVAPTTSSEYVAPTTSSVYVAPTTSSTSAYVAPTTTAAATSAYIAPTSSTSSAAAASSSAASSSTGDNSGQLSWYTPGLGSCGVTNTITDYTVALAVGMMQANWPLPKNTNDNPLCGSEIAITYNGKTLNAKITDTCPGCVGADLDLTPGLWAAFDDYTGSLDEATMIANTQGILKPATWSYV